MILSQLRGYEPSYAICRVVARTVERKDLNVRLARARLGVNSYAARLATSLLAVSWRRRSWKTRLSMKYLNSDSIYRYDEMA